MDSSRTGLWIQGSRLCISLSRQVERDRGWKDQIEREDNQWILSKLI